MNSKSDKAHKQLSAKFRSHSPSAKSRAANSACRLVASDKRNASTLGRQAQLTALGEAVAHYLAQGGEVQTLPPAKTPKVRMMDTWPPEPW